MEGGIFLTVKDLQRLLGCDNYNTANRHHLAIRDALGKKSKHLTIKEYCEYEELDFKYVWEFLRTKNKS
jgi:hypothetical protein